MNVPSIATVIAVLAHATFRRLVRGRSLWVGGVLALLPALFVLGVPRSAMKETFSLALLPIAVLAPMYVGAALGDEIEDKSATYLWSRPLPRWTVLAGKLAAIIPLIAGFATAGWLLANVARGVGLPAATSIVALVLGALCFSLIATALATLAPKHGMAVSIVYIVFFDLGVGVMPWSLRVLSVSYQLHVTSGMWTEMGSSIAMGIVGALVNATVFGSLAAWRIRKLES